MSEEKHKAAKPRTERCCVCGRELPPGAGRYLLEKNVAICPACNDEVRRTKSAPHAPSK